MSDKLNSKVVTATKWSSITEIAAKLVSPISAMVLARLLTPEAFGVLVTATMVISFAEVFTDAGFQKYLIQHEFKSEEALYKSTAVAFWTNLTFSLLLWLVIVIFSPEIAHFVGNDGRGLVIAVASVCIPLAAFSSIQMALFKREMDFRTLFHVRIVGVIIPFVITIPLAYATRSYWALVIGMISLNVSNALFLTWKSKWKPKWFYDVKLFKEMFSFTMWSMFEAVATWFTAYLDVFIVGTMLSTYYMGLYRTGISTVGQIMGLITSATTPVLFSALSRLQKNDNDFKDMLFKFQKTVGILIIPLGVGLFLFRDLVTDIILGDQWKEAASLIGWFGLTGSVAIVMGQYCSEVFRAKGRPKLSVLSQCILMAFLIPTVYISVQYGFEALSIARSLVRLVGVTASLIILYCLVKISPVDMLKNLGHIIFATLIMVAVFNLLPTTSSLIIQVIYAIIVGISYFAILCMFKEERELLLKFRTIIKR